MPSNKPGLRTGRTTRRAAAFAMLSAVALAQPAVAQFYLWNGAAGGAWDTTSASWLANGGGSPTAWVNGNEARFGGSFTGTRTMTMGAGISATGVDLRSGGTGVYTISGGSGLTLNNASGDEYITVSNPAGSFYTGLHLISAPVTFTDTLNITNNGGIFGAISLNLTGAITTTAAGGKIVFDGAGHTDVDSSISANITNGIEKNGPGTTQLESNPNNFLGNVVVNGGVLAISSQDGMLGNATNQVTLNAGGTFRAFGGVSSARRFNINGTAANPSGIDNSSGLTTTLNGTGATAGLVGSGALNLTLTNGATAGIVSIEGDQTGFTGTINVGSSGMRLVGSNVTSRLFQPTNGATLRLQNSGKLANATGITVNHSGALIITQPTTAVTGRLGTAPITLNGARFQYNPSSTAAIADSFGAVEMTGSVWLTGGSAGNAGGTTLSFGDLTRTDNATIALRAPTSGTGVIGGGANTGVNYKFNNLTDVGGTGTSRNVVPWAAAVGSTSGTDFNNLVTYDANGFRQLAASEVQVVTTTLTAGVNNNLQGTANNPGVISINSLINTTSTPQITGTGNVTVTSGAVANFNTLTINGPTFTFPNGGYFHLGFPIVVTGTSVLAGSSGIGVQAIGASSSYQLQLTNTVANTFTGGLTINGNAGVTFRANNQLGNDGSGNAAGLVTLGGGQLIFNPATAVTVSLNDGANNRPIKAGPAGGVIGTAVAGAVLQIPGTISGSGQVQYGGGASSNGTGVVELTNTSANTYTGGSVIGAGILRISNPNQLGTGEVFLNGGTLQAGGNLTFTSGPVMVASSTIDTQANTVILSGGLGGSGGTLGTAAQANQFTKQGTGTLRLSGTGNFAGTFSVAGGTMQVDSGAAIGLGTINVAAGATMRVDGTVAASANSVTLTTGTPGARLTGTGTINRQVFANSGARIEPGNSVGNLTVSSITLNAATLNFESGPGNTLDKLIVLGTASFVTGNSTLNVTGSYLATGNYDFVSYATKAGGLSTGVTLGTTPGGPFTYALNFDSDSYFLIVTQTGNDFAWDFDSGTAGAQDGSSPPNWTDTVSVWDNILTTNATWANATTNVMNFGGIGGAGPFTVTVDGTKTAASLNFTKNYTLQPLAGETLRLQNGISASANATVSVPVTMLANNTFSSATGATLSVTAGVGENVASLTLTKTGAGTLVLGGAAGYTGVTNINGGTVAVSAANQLGSANINLSGGTLLATADFSGGQQISLTGTDNGIGAASGVTMTRTTATAATVAGFTKVGAGTVLFTAPLNNSGGIGVSAGSLVLGTGATIPAIPSVTLASGGTISFVNGINNTISGTVTSLAGSGINLGTNATLTLSGSTSRTVNATVTGPGSLAWTPSSVATLTMGGANTHAGGTTGNANARFAINNAAAFGTGPLTLADTTNSFSSPAIAFQFPTNTMATVPNDIAISTVASATTTFAALTGGGGGTSQVITLSGVISAGAATHNLDWDETGSTDSNVLILTNASNTFRSTIRPRYGVIAFTSDAALGNSANAIDLTQGNTTTTSGIRFDANDITLAGTRNIVTSITKGINTQANNGTIAGVISGAGALTKSGTGRLTLSNTGNTYTGAITVSAGDLNLKGPGVVLPTTSNAITVNSGASLSGDGTANRPVTIGAGGTVAPGNSVGELTLGALTLSGTADANPANNSVLSIEVNQDNSTADKLVITNSSALVLTGSTLQFTFVGTNAGPFAQSFVIVQDTGNNNPGATPSFEVVTPPSMAGQIVEYALAYVNSDAGTFANDIRVTFVSVPEPAAMSLLAVGASVLTRRRRR